jgi:hypothetical protein
VAYLAIGPPPHTRRAARPAPFAAAGAFVAPSSSFVKRVVQDPVDIDRRIQRLIARVDRRDDYGRLLARGDVVRRIGDMDDVDGWRAEIKRQARADKIKVRTGVSRTTVWAVRMEQPGWELEARRYRQLLARIVPLSVDLHHEPTVALRDADEVICACDRCSALGYGNMADEVTGGSLFEDPCPNEEPPKITSLGVMFGPR